MTEETTATNPVVEAPKKEQPKQIGSQCRPRKGTLRPSHLCKTDRRHKNRLARKARRIQLRSGK
jgi:hypothetical protein